MEYNITSTVNQLAAIHLATGDIFWSSTRKGTTGQGHTYETNVVVKPEDNLAKADYLGTEIKTSSTKSGRVRQFTLAFGNEQLLTTTYGRVNRENKLCLNRSLRVGKTARWGGTEVNLSLDDQALRLTAGAIVSEIPRERITQVLDEKMTNLMIVSVQKRRQNGDWAYRYPAFTYYGGIDHERFFNALHDGTIAVEFRFRGDKDKGTSFNINKKKLSSLYRYQYEWNLRDGVPREIKWS